MADPQISPISQLLYTLGLTREDLTIRSDQMRQFLTADDTNSSRVLELDTGHRSRSSSDLCSTSRSVGSSRSFTSSHSRASSISARDGTPPVTPVKSEPHEGEIPHRRMDSMEMVLERQRRHRKSRRGREREPNKNPPHLPSPSPSNASQSGHSLDIFMQSRDDARILESTTSENALDGSAETPETVPVTPHKSKYYRDHTNLSINSQQRKDSASKAETPTPTRLVALHPPQSLPLAQYYAYPGYMGYSHLIPMTFRPTTSTSTFSHPITPLAERIQTPTKKATPSPLPPSSPPPASSPMSSPSRVNVVSSPGPMGPAPEENEYDNLPYKLPPGPYSPTKPDLSYAALVGQAILSSPEHRLTLQEIYDWITIVYPHYKRGETTWMNSIRHVLSTTVCFRKVPRDRSIGRTLWAIYDEDLECFKDGGFKKQLCKDYMNGNDGKDKQASGSKGKARARKRGDDDEATGERKPKKFKKDSSFSAAPASESVAPSLSYLGSTSDNSHPYFPPTRPTTHHQPYYPSSLTQHQSFSSEIIFPPLPATAAFNRVVLTTNSASSLGSSLTTGNEASSMESKYPLVNDGSPPSPSAPSSSSLSSITSSSSMSELPDLTPNRSSSPSSSSLPATSDLDIEVDSGSTELYVKESVAVASLENESENDNSISDDDIFNTVLLGPVKFWGQLPKNSGGLQPGIELSGRNTVSDADDVFNDNKDKKSKGSVFPPVPSSPTLDRPKYSLKRADNDDRSPSPPTSLVPSTPPRSTRPDHEISSVRTPISHKGLHMSPTASLIHYKSNLDPPPVYGGLIHPLELAPAPDDDDPMRTPRRHDSGTTSSMAIGPPITPRKLVFNIGDSPFRTPIGASPFRTPGSRSIFDPHDPRLLLDEELNRMPYSDSPAGLFGKSRSSLLLRLTILRFYPHVFPLFLNFFIG